MHVARLLRMRARSPLRRITTWCLILGYALVASGIPLPFGGGTPSQDPAVARETLAGKDRSRPFPCMDKPCGCATAEQCFKNCCCHTPAQRLAWAKAHDVEAAVLEQFERRVAAAEPATGAGSCCAKKAKPAPLPSLERVDVCDAYASLAAEPVARSAACHDAATTATDEKAPAPRTGRTVILREMLACGGVAAGWLAAGVSLPPPAHVAAIVTVSPPTAALVFIDAVAEGRRPLPDLPPPRV
jgi:hypothetical protein